MRPCGHAEPAEYDRGFRLACQTRVIADVTVTIPETIKADGQALKRKPKTTRAISARSMATWSVPGSSIRRWTSSSSSCRRPPWMTMSPICNG